MSDIDFDKIEALRKHLLISKRSMAKVYGVSRMAYYNWCKGKTQPKNKTLEGVIMTTKKLLRVMTDHDWPDSKVFEMGDEERLDALRLLIAEME